MSAGSAKRLKKEIPDSEPTRYTFPAPVLTITGDGPVFDSNWYRSVLEEPGLMGYRMEDGCALSDAYETLLLNQTRIQYDILILTEIMFQRGFARVPGYHRTADEGDEDWKDCNDDDDDVVNGEDKDNDEA